MAWTFGDFRLDAERFELFCSGQRVRLEPQVLALLVHLMCHRDRMVTKEEIAEAIWQRRSVSDASIASRIRSARQAVGDDGAAQSVIRTIHGRGSGSWPRCRRATPHSPTRQFKPLIRLAR